MNWPELPKTDFISGRVAKNKDIEDKKAAFLLQRRLFQKHKPLNIEIPQYAYYMDSETKMKIPGIIIQGEQLSKLRIIGFKPLDKDEFVAALIDEFILLGKEKPE